jgi:hypothetical protein
MLSRLESLELMQSILPQHSSVDAWMAWVKRNFHLSATTAKSYMKLAETTHKDSRLSFSTLSEVVSPHRKHHQPTWHQPVRETMNRVNVESLADKWLAVSVIVPTSGSLNRPPICRTRPGGVFCLDRDRELFRLRLVADLRKFCRLFHSSASSSA